MITPEQLFGLLEAAGLEVVKTENNPRNIGKTGVLVLSEIINDITLKASLKELIGDKTLVIPNPDDRQHVELTTLDLADPNRSPYLE